MVEKLISFSLKKSSCFARFRLLVWLGIYSVQNPIDAIPDLSENQVIVLQVDG
jgi:Cu/Ag efflux pump CusA